jgi:hypothetical protein
MTMWDGELIIRINEMPACIRRGTSLIRPICSTPNGSMEIGFIRKNSRNTCFLQIRPVRQSKAQSHQEEIVPRGIQWWDEYPLPIPEQIAPNKKDC